MSTEAAILKGKGIVANPEFVVSFGLSALFAVAGCVTALMSWLDYSEEGEFEGVRLWAIGIVVVLGLLAAVAAYLNHSGHGEEALFTGLVAVMGLITGFVAIGTLFLLWGSPAESGWMGVDGFGKPLIGAMIAVLLLVMAPAAIYGESILPIFIAFIAGVWGILSVIVFVMVVFVGVE